MKGKTPVKLGMRACTVHELAAGDGVGEWNQWICGKYIQR